MKSQLASWVHTTEDYPDNLWMDCEYARKACTRTGARINFDIHPLEFGPPHPHARAYTNTVVIHDLLPYLDDYIMSAHDPIVEDFTWSMDDNGHTESKSRNPLKVMCRSFCFLQIVMSSAQSGQQQLVLQPKLQGRDPSGARAFAEVEVKRHRQGLKRAEMGSSDVLDVTVFNLGNLARQTIQRQAEPRMLRLIMNQTSHIKMLVEGTSLAVHQWDKKLKEANWHSVHPTTTIIGYSGTSVKKLVDNCVSEQQKIWYAVFEVTL